MSRGNLNSLPNAITERGISVLSMALLFHAYAVTIAPGTNSGSFDDWFSVEIMSALFRNLW